jgi:hypothetical protein
MTQNEEYEKERNKKWKKYLHGADDPARLPAKRVYPFGPLPDEGQGNPKRKDA